MRFRLGDILYSDRQNKIVEISYHCVMFGVDVYSYFDNTISIEIDYIVYTHPIEGGFTITESALRDFKRIGVL